MDSAALTAKAKDVLRIEADYLRTTIENVADAGVELARLVVANPLDDERGPCCYPTPPAVEGVHAADCQLAGPADREVERLRDELRREKAARGEVETALLVARKERPVAGREVAAVRAARGVVDGARWPMSRCKCSRCGVVHRGRPVANDTNAVCAKLDGDGLDAFRRVIYSVAEDAGACEKRRARVLSDALATIVRVCEDPENAIAGHRARTLEELARLVIDLAVPALATYRRPR